MAQMVDLLACEGAAERHTIAEIVSNETGKDADNRAA